MIRATMATEPMVSDEPEQGKEPRAWWMLVAVAVIIAGAASWSWYRSHQESVQRERRVNETACLIERDMGLRADCP